MKVKTLLMMLFSMMLAGSLATFAAAQTSPDNKPKADNQKKTTMTKATKMFPRTNENK